MLGSGNSSSTSSLISSIDFSPVINFGQGNKSDMDKTTDQTATTSPRQDNSATASLGLGIAGGSGSGGAVQRVQDESTPSALSSLDLSSRDKQNLTYLGFAVVGVTGVYFLIKASNNKKKK